MQGIAYILKGKPYLTWPASIKKEIVDAEGEPTGEFEITDDLQERIAALPEGTQYELITLAAKDADGEFTGEEAAAWLEANQNPKEKIKKQITALEAQQSKRMVRGAALGKPEDVAMLNDIETRIAELRAQL